MINTGCVHYSHGVKMSKMTTMKTIFIPSDFLSYVLSFILSLVLFFFLSLKIQNHECAEGSPYVPTVAVPYEKDVESCDGRNDPSHYGSVQSGFGT